jgi:transcriptional regulator with XRE-family HTH domain
VVADREIGERLCCAAMTRTKHRIRQRDPEFVARIGPRLRGLREAARMTQAQVAEGICTKAAISAIESGKALPSLDLLTQLATRLGVSPVVIIGDDAVGAASLRARIRAVEIDRGRVVAELTDGRIVGVPLTSVPRFLDATLRDLADWRLGTGRQSIEWPALDITLSLESFLSAQQFDGSAETEPERAKRGRPRRRVGSASTNGS